MLMIKEIRKRQGLTQADVASKLKMSRSSYTNIENGKRDPDTETIMAIADLLGVSIDTLFGRDAEMEVDDQFRTMYTKLTDSEKQRVIDFMSGISAKE